jgi:hypothetical protein
LEIYPKGEFTPILGHGNVARKMGLRYGRVDVAKSDSLGTGAVVPVDQLTKALVKMIEEMRGKPTCVLPAVLEDPYLESVL